MEKLFGIDISHWQGDMSIEQARNERGVRFAIIKAAGADDGKYKDSKFENYYAQCKAIGLPVGAYYYGNAKSVAEAEQEADHFLSVIAGKQFEYPIYYDVEGKMLNNSRDVLTDIVIAFCDKCEKAGYFVGVYTSDSHFQAHVDDDRLQRFTHWVLEEFEELKERFDQTEEILKNVWLLTKQNATKETFKAVLEDANAITIQLVAEAVKTAAMFQKFEQFNGKRV